VGVCVCTFAPPFVSPLPAPFLYLSTMQLNCRRMPPPPHAHDTHTHTHTHTHQISEVHPHSIKPSFSILSLPMYTMYPGVTASKKNMAWLRACTTCERILRLNCGTKMLVLGLLASCVSGTPHYALGGAGAASISSEFGPVVPGYGAGQLSCTVAAIDCNNPCIAHLGTEVVRSPFPPACERMSRGRLVCMYVWDVQLDQGSAFFLIALASPSFYVRQCVIQLVCARPPLRSQQA
jgi:hypothetical protein